MENVQKVIHPAAMPETSDDDLAVMGSFLHGVRTALFAVQDAALPDEALFDCGAAPWAAHRSIALEWEEARKSIRAAVQSVNWLQERVAIAAGLRRQETERARDEVAAAEGTGSA